MASVAARRGSASRCLSLRGRLVLLVMACVTPLVGFSLGQNYLNYRDNVAMTGERTRELARSMSLQVDQELQARIAVLQSMAVSSSLQAGDLERVRAQAETVVAEQFPDSNILLLKEDGEQVMNTFVPAGAPIPPRPSLESTRQVFATGRPAVSNLFQGAVRARPVVAIDVPVKGPDGTVIQVLSLSPNLGAFGDSIRRQHLPAQWVIAVFDRRGVIIARIPAGDSFIGHEAALSLHGPLQAERDGIVESTSLEGIPLLTAFSDAGRFGWKVAIGVPRGELTAPALSAALRTLAVGGGLLLVSLALALYAARRIGGPIESLRRLASTTDRDALLNPPATGLGDTDEVAEALRVAEQGRRRGEQALKDREEKLSQAQRLAHMGSIHVNLQTEETDWSDEIYRIFGVSRETFVPSMDNYLRMIHPDDQAAVRGIQVQVRQGINPQPMEYRIIRPDGTVRQIYRESEVIRDEAGNPLYVNSTIQDITERCQTEDQLRQAQKMEAIGNLTGGMAHDFNNLLGIIIGNLDLLRDRQSGDPEADEITSEALDAALRGADLTRRLLAFARRQPLQPARTDVNALIAGIIKLLERTLGEEIQITLDLNPDTWPVVVDPAQLESALTNLATNARDAMPGGGQLIIVTENRSLDADYASQHAELQPGDYTMIEVSDTGTGMSAEVASRIFEPFYTTKEPGKGTGLGLSMVFGFIKQSGGHINVYSEIGIGTTFRLFLPRANIGAEAGGAIGPAAPVRGNGETVLAVEDNASLRRVVVRQLTELGYRVIEAEEAQMALRLLEREPVDLLFTDIVMPGGTSGYELARTALSRWPAIKIVLTSGFPENKINDDPNAPSLRLLSKPYRRDDLGRTIRDVLDS
jgi:PAS domain S-box-containing protein